MLAAYSSRDHVPLQACNQLSSSYVHAGNEATVRKMLMRAKLATEKAKCSLKPIILSAWSQTAL